MEALRLFFFSSLLCPIDYLCQAMPSDSFPSLSVPQPAVPGSPPADHHHHHHHHHQSSSFRRFLESADRLSSVPTASKPRFLESPFAPHLLPADSSSNSYAVGSASESDSVSAIDGMVEMKGEDSRLNVMARDLSEGQQIGAKFLEALLGARAFISSGVKVRVAWTRSGLVRVSGTKKISELSGTQRIPDADDAEEEGVQVKNRVRVSEEFVAMAEIGRYGGGLTVVESDNVVVLILWMLLLLYLLGTTASDYFSCTLEKLSAALNLSPSLAGVTLLAVGNGAPDVFSSFMAFVSSDTTGSIGFGSVLGGALFITTVVSGAVAIISATTKLRRRRRRRRRRKRRRIIAGNGVCRTAQMGKEGRGEGDAEVNCDAARCGHHHVCCQGMEEIGDGEEAETETEEEESVRIGLFCFVRDIAVLLLTLTSLTLILLDGKVYLWEAMAFLALYPGYVVLVFMTEFSHCCFCCTTRRPSEPLLIKVSLQAASEESESEEESSPPPPPPLPLPPDLPLLLPPPPPHHVHSHELEERLLHNGNLLSKCIHILYKYCIEFPCAVPRLLTIPMIEEGRWSRWQAVISCTLAPVFAIAVWILQQYVVSVRFLAISVGIGLLVGVLLGLLSFLNTENARPPQKFVWIWLAGGFFMSITWFYLVANQLVASLESLGTLLGISPAILGLTILAWGNSIGDLVADLSLAFVDSNGAQIAIAGCYAGPIFSIVLGLGLSLVVCSWRCKPKPYLITRDDDDTVFFMIGFLAAGLIWGLIIMPLRGMKLSKSYGVGLVVIYCIFLIVGLAYTL